MFTMVLVCMYPARFLCPWDSSGKNTAVGCHFLLQEIFLTQRLKLHLLTSVLNFFERYGPLSRKRQVSSKFPILHFQVFMDLVNTLQCVLQTSASVTHS